MPDLHACALDAIPYVRGEQGGLPCRVHGERRAFRRPHQPVFLRRSGRPGPQHDPVEDRQPKQTRQLHDERVGQELREIVAHRIGRRCARRAEVDEQDGTHGGIARLSATFPRAIEEEAAMLMSGNDYRESLKRYRPRVFVNGEAVGSVADHPALAPGVAAVGLTYDFALREELRPVMRAPAASGPAEVNRMMAIPTSGQDLLNKLEAVRLVCQHTGCAQRYLGGDALSAIRMSAARVDADLGTEYGARLDAYIERVYEEDLTLGVAMTDGKGDRSLRPHRQPNPDAYVRIVERTQKGIVLSGAKAIVTGAPYMHELLVMPCRNMIEADRDYAVCCAVPIDAEGLTIVARPAGRPGEPAAKFSGRYGQSTGVAIFDRVLVPWERVFLAGEWQHSGPLTYSYATHHRHTCIGARAGFGDLLIGAGALMTEANGIDLDE